MSGRGPKRKMLFVAGGTGGHIYPALAVGRALGQKHPDVETLYVCGSKTLEVELYRREGVEPHVLDIQPLRSGIVSRVSGAVKLAGGFLSALRLLRSWRPHRVMGQGGYVTAPVLLAARVLGIPCDLQEQNSVPGRANRWFARWAEEIFCSFAEAPPLFPPSFRSRCVFTGMPLRASAVQRNGASLPESRKVWGLDPDLTTLLVIGGSQGARSLNAHLLKSLRELDCVSKGGGEFQCLWSTGEANYSMMKDALGSEPFSRIRVKLVPFIGDVGSAYASADAVLSRSGACSVAEICANGLPAVFIPLAHAIGNHQKINAMAAEKVGAAMVITEDQLETSALTSALCELLNSRETRERMGRCARMVFPGNAAEIIAEKIYEKLQKKCLKSG
ncbi:MAG TPA: UDP-N-acetylglucosamine--N-acetylmuramyl-(pentapeptide) pyrophosphoryl-undecaprenol N-acetylglucosamine transferase [Candidatus Sumerlaeota bacterium]|nr:UDP-N-acetylglucosamine--N-acetylmuramyl-(pentapeptide) pyrophosphoryl-undecaprenol N-acetylglucosamine transferase [Candidatus Sumerlaeota bacterium]